MAIGKPPWLAVGTVVGLIVGSLAIKDSWTTLAPIYSAILGIAGGFFLDRFLNQRWPILALAGFLAWKATWVIGLQIVRRHQRAAPD